MLEVKLVPWQKLSPDALKGLIMDVITREGTDVHDTDTFSADNVVQTVIEQLKAGLVTIVFDEMAGSCNIVSTDDLDM
jgi:uncharacterized protein YheU (UPF0270 family)